MNDPPSRPGGSAALLTTLDQILSSASNALLLFVLAQVATVAEFGVVALQIAIVMAWVGFNRGAVGTPILLASDLTKRQVLAEAGYAVTFSSVTSVGAVAAILGVGWATGEVSMAVALAAVVPVVLAQDVLRFPAIACGTPAVALAADGLWTAGMAVIFVANLAGAVVPLEVAVALWGLMGAVSAVMLAVLTPVKLHADRLWSWWRTYMPARLRFGGTYASVALSTAVTVAVVAAVAGAAVAGAIRGAGTLFGPIMMLIMAVPMVFVPHVRRASASRQAQWRLLIKTSFVTSGLAVAATAVVLIVPAELGTRLLGQTWETAVTAAPYIGLECAANCWIVGVYSWLQAQGMGRTLFRMRVVQLTVQLGACAIAAAAIGSVVAVAAALAVSCWLIALIGLMVVRRAVAAPDTGPGGMSGRPEDRTCDQGDTAQPWPTIDVLEDEIRRTRNSAR